MAVSLKKTFAAVALVLALLASMFGWTMRVSAAMPQHHAFTGNGHQTALMRHPVCPPPPYDCLG